MDELSERISDSFRVVNPNNNDRLIAKVDKGEIRIFDKRLKSLYIFPGIVVPPHLRESLQGKVAVQFGDKLFDQAFMTAGIWQLKRSGYAIKQKE